MRKKNSAVRLHSPMSIVLKRSHFSKASYVSLAASEALDLFGLEDGTDLTRISNLGRPDLLTFSAADYHWDSLQKYMPRYNEWRDGTAAERMLATTLILPPTISIDGSLFSWRRLLLLNLTLRI